MGQPWTVHGVGHMRELYQEIMSCKHKKSLKEWWGVENIIPEWKTMGGQSQTVIMKCSRLLLHRDTCNSGCKTTPRLWYCRLTWNCCHNCVLTVCQPEHHQDSEFVYILCVCLTNNNFQIHSKDLVGARGRLDFWTAGHWLAVSLNQKRLDRFSSIKLVEVQIHL